MANILQGVSYKVCPTTATKFFPFGIFILDFGISAITVQRDKNTQFDWLTSSSSKAVLDR